MTEVANRRPRVWTSARANALFAIIAVVCVLLPLGGSPAGYVSRLALLLAVVFGLVEISNSIVRSPTDQRAVRWKLTLGVIIASVAAIVFSETAAVLPWPLADAATRAGITSLAWLACAWVLRWSGANVELAPASEQSRARPRPWWTVAIGVVTLLLLGFAALVATLAAGGWPNVAANLLIGTGFYYALLGLGCGLCCWAGIGLERQGITTAVPPVTNLTRDRQLIEKWGGRVLAASGLGASLVCLRAAQAAYAPLIADAATSQTVSRTIGPFDLLTWLGTLGTLVIVIAGALVAMYVKRRDDESQHTSAVTIMRQQWIDRSRELLSELLALGESLRARMEAGDWDRSLGPKVLVLLRAFELQLNPVEPIPRVLLSALKSWLLEAGIFEHSRAEPAAKSSLRTDFDITTDWLVGLGQLVLKTEWAVTSVGRHRVVEKLWSTWNSVVAYEQRYREELQRVAPQAIAIRERDAPTISTLVSEGRTSRPSGTGGTELPDADPNGATSTGV